MYLWCRNNLERWFRRNLSLQHRSVTVNRFSISIFRKRARAVERSARKNINANQYTLYALLVHFIFSSIDFHLPHSTHTHTHIRTRAYLLRPRQRTCLKKKTLRPYVTRYNTCPCTPVYLYVIFCFLNYIHINTLISLFPAIAFYRHYVNYRTQRWEKKKKQEMLIELQNLHYCRSNIN